MDDLWLPHAVSSNSPTAPDRGGSTPPRLARFRSRLYVFFDRALWPSRRQSDTPGGGKSARRSRPGAGNAPRCPSARSRRLHRGPAHLSAGAGSGVGGLRHYSPSCINHAVEVDRLVGRPQTAPSHTQAACQVTTRERLRLDGSLLQQLFALANAKAGVLASGLRRPSGPGSQRRAPTRISIPAISVEAPVVRSAQSARTLLAPEDFSFARWRQGAAVSNDPGDRILLAR